MGARGYQVAAPVVLPAAAFTGVAATQADGYPLILLPGPLADDDPHLAKWRGGAGEWCAFDW